MALHKKPSCCGVKYSHMGSGVLQKATVIYHNDNYHKVCCCMKKCNLNICYTRRKLCCDAASFSGPELIPDSQKDSENVSCTQMSPNFNYFLGKMVFQFSVPKTKGTIQTFISDRSKSKNLSWYGGAAEQTTWVTEICPKVLLKWRHIVGLYRDIYCHQDDVFHGKSMVIISRQCQLSFCMCYIVVS